MVAYTQLPKRQVSHTMVYGEPKTGKSTLVSELALAPDAYKLIWFSLDNGHDIIGKLPLEAQERCDVIVLPDTRDFPVGIDTLLKVFTGAPVSICHMHGQVNCSFCKKAALSFSDYELGKVGLDTIVVIDHMSQVADSAWNLITQNFDVMTNITAQKKESQDNYMKLGFLMNKLLSSIQQSRWHVCCISQAIETELEDGSKKLVPRIGSMPFSKTAGSYFDHLIYCELMNKTHKFGSASTYKVNAVTGSRGDVAIEKQAGKPKLASFFNGAVSSIAPTALDKNAGEEEKLLKSAQTTGSSAGMSDALAAAKERLANIKKGS